MDLTKYGASPYGEGSPKRNDQQNTLSAILRGALGQEEQGSVLDERTAGLKEANSSANLVSILSDLVPVKGAAGVLPHAAGIFIGPKAKTWNTQAAAKAIELLRAGKDPEYVRQLTGTSHFPDTGLRQEIDDSGATLLRQLRSNADYAPLDKQLQHNEFEAAYPGMLTQLQAKINQAPDPVGSFMDTIDVSAPNEAKAKSLLIHELQHAVQKHEGHARGGSPEEFIKAAKWAERVQKKPDGWAEGKAYSDYLRLAGESEARLAQSRRALTKPERAAAKLEWDVDPSKQTLKWYAGQNPLVNQ